MRNFSRFSILALIAVACLQSCSNVPESADVKISTSFGDIYVDLYDQTPKHKSNFELLAKEGYYNGTSFHRVIADFMIQGGDPNSKEGASGQPGMGGPGWFIDREIVPGLFHKRGAVAAARMPDQVNPEWQSSGSQFYIVTGKKFDDSGLDQVELNRQMYLESYIRQQFESKPENQWIRTIDMIALQTSNPDSFAVMDAKIQAAYKSFRALWPEYKLTTEQRNAYKTAGGRPDLDAMYTIFGEVVMGMEVVDEIAKVQKGPMDNPLEPIRMEVELLK